MRHLCDAPIERLEYRIRSELERHPATFKVNKHMRSSVWEISWTFRCPLFEGMEDEDETDLPNR